MAPQTDGPGSEAVPAPWGLFKRVCFRFAFVYLVLYCFPVVLTLPVQFYSDWPTVLWQPYMQGSEAVVSWAAEHVFQVALPARLGARGDITADYIQIFCYLVLAAALTLVWSLLDRKRRNYTCLFACLRIGVCFYLAAQMISYGACKLIPNQFGSPAPEVLTTMVGDVSRMSLLWTFMGASAGYTMFTGAAELLGGLLLCWRRTRLLGALVCIGVMANVVMLNFCYDVCVKLHSSHLLAMCFFMAAADLRRLLDFFVLGRTPQPVAHERLFAPKWLSRGAQFLITALVLGFLGLSLHENVVRSQAHGHLAPKPPLSGMWVVKEYVADGVVQSPLVTDQTYWKWVSFNPGYPEIFPATLSIKRLDNVRQVFVLDLNTTERTIGLAKFDDPIWKTVLTYSEPEPRMLVLHGTLDGRQVRITLQGVNESQLPLNQPFRWISDYGTAIQ